MVDIFILNLWFIVFYNLIVGLQYKDTDCTIKIKLGNNLYSFQLGDLSYRTSSGWTSGYLYEGNYFNSYAVELYLGEHNHNPTTGERPSDSCYIEIKSTNQSSLKGKSGNFNVNYTSMKLVSLPSTNYNVIRLHSGVSSSDNLVITTNRSSSDLTHKIYLTVRETSYCTLHAGNSDYTSLNVLDNYPLSTNAGESYSISFSSLYSLLNNRNYDSLVDSRPTYGAYIPGFIKCETWCNGKILGAMFMEIDIAWKNINSNYGPTISKLSISNAMMSNNKLYVLNTLHNDFEARGTLISTRSGVTFNKLYFSVCGSKGIEHDISLSSSRSVDLAYSIGSYYTETSSSQSSIGVVSYNSNVNTSEYKTWYGYFNVLQYKKPSLNSVNIYRVDSNDNVDDEGRYLHIQFNGSIFSTQYRDTSLKELSLPAGYNFNYMTVELYYKKSTDSSWSHTTLISNDYDNDVSYDFRYTGQTFDPTASYDLELRIRDKWSNYIENIYLQPPIILIDYNASGKSLSFGKISEASEDEEIMETVLPIIFSTTQNRTDSWTPSDNYIKGDITQRGSNTKKYNHAFIGLDSKKSRLYSLSVYDTDSTIESEIRLYNQSAYIGIQWTNGWPIFRMAWGSSDFYIQAHVVSNRANIQTSATEGFYFNKPLYYSSYYIPSVASKNMVDTMGEKKSYIRFNVGDQTLLMVWGRTSITTSNGSWASKTIDFPTSFNNNHYPAVFVTPMGDNVTRLQVTNVGNSNFKLYILGSSAKEIEVYFFAICCG